MLGVPFDNRKTLACSANVIRRIASCYCFSVRGLLNRRGNGVAHRVGQCGHGARLRRHPSAPSVASFVERGQAGAAQQIVRHGRGKRIPGADGVGNLNGKSRVLVPLVARDQQAAAAAPVMATSARGEISSSRSASGALARLPQADHSLRVLRPAPDRAVEAPAAPHPRSS